MKKKQGGGDVFNSSKENKVRCKKAKEELFNRLDMAEEKENELGSIKQRVIDDTELLDESNYDTEYSESTNKTYEDIVGIRKHIGVVILSLAIVIGLITALCIFVNNV